MATLYYFHDPMCSWCYAFGPALAAVEQQLPAGVGLVRVLGGLAPDSDEPMAGELREQLQASWRRIEQRVPGSEFNHDFWARCQPRRSTYPACRAVIAARLQGQAHEYAMTRAIQHAYYRQARNPSDDTTLLELAGEIGLDEQQFHDDLLSPGVDELLCNEIAFTTERGVSSFPALVLEVGGSYWPVAVDYNEPQRVVEAIGQLLEIG